MNFDKLYEIAKNKLNVWKLSKNAESGGVSAALLTENGNVYTGVCIDISCSIGFCAERAAAAAMINERENKVVKMIAVLWNGKIIPPCGVCREFISSLHKYNTECLVKINENDILPLKELLPHDWKYSK